MNTTIINYSNKFNSNIITKTIEINTYKNLFFFTITTTKNIKLITNYNDLYTFIINTFSY